MSIGAPIVAALSADLSGRYVVEREIGSGGMASVYAARDIRHDRRVALKVLRPELAAVIGAERFLAEIRTTAQLQHPGILPLFDSGEAAGQLFYVMPFVEGETLRARLERERQLPTADAVRIAVEIGDALAYAHEHHVIHRDIKPENILFQGGRPVVADFGIALAVQEAGGHRLTQTGLSLGTPQYMAPEQAAGERGIDGRADQYALAAVLYEMLAGEPPFSAPTVQALVAKVLTEDVASVMSLRKSVPDHVATAVHRALEKVPADRFSSTRAFVDALTNETVVSGSRRAPATRRGIDRRWAAIAAGALVAGVAIGVAADRAFRRTTTTEEPVAPITFTLEPDSRERVAFVCCGNIFTISPDGRRIAFQATDPDSITRLHIRDLDILTTRALVGTENPQELFFAPDGQHVGFFSGRTIKSVDLRSGRVRSVADVSPIGFLGGGTWTTDGRIIYAVGNRLFTVAADGGDPTEIARVDSAQKEFQIGGPHYVADAGLVLFAVERGSREPLVRALWLASGKTKDIALGVAPHVVTDGGFLLAVRSDGTVEARRFNAQTGDTVGGPVRVAESVVLRSPVFLYAEFTASPNGTIVTVTRSPYSMGGQAALNFTVNGKEESHPLPFRARGIRRPRFSPDGKLVLALEDDLDRRITLPFIYDVQRRTTTPLSVEGNAEGSEWVGADSVVSVLSNNDILIQNISGSVPRRLGTLKGWANVRWMNAHGPWIVFDGDRGSSNDIGLMHRDSIDHARVLVGSAQNERSPRISPDGRKIAFLVSNGTDWTIHVASFPSVADEIVVGPAFPVELRWRPNGTLYYVGTDLHVVAVTLQSGPKLGVASKTVLPWQFNNASPGWDIDITGTRFVHGADAGNRNGPARLVVTMNALPKH